MTFLQFIESLEEILTCTEKDIRLNGVKAFVSVLQKLPLDFFLSEELDYINRFLCERFIDHHSFVPTVLTGIEYTVNKKKINIFYYFLIYTIIIMCIIYNININLGTNEKSNQRNGCTIL